MKQLGANVSHTYQPHLALITISRFIFIFWGTLKTPSYEPYQDTIFSSLICWSSHTQTDGK